MKKFIAILCGFFVVLGLINIAGATSISIDVAGAPGNDGFGSMVSIVADPLWCSDTNLTAELADGLDDVSFDLDLYQSYSFDFIKFVTTGTGIGLFDVDAVLAFEQPEEFSSDFSNSCGVWFALDGYFSGGALFWENPFQDFTLADGNILRIALEQGITIVPGNTIFLAATVTNLGGAAPVPEPATILLLGTGLVGLAGFGRKKVAL